MNKLTSVIVGFGTVGKATAHVFGTLNYYSRRDHNVELKDLADFDIIFICIPTPTDAFGNYKLDDLFSLVEKITETKKDKTPLIVIRSTVPPGTAKKLQEQFNYKYIVSNPEFLSEDTALTDARFPDLVVVGEDLQGIAKPLVDLYMKEFSAKFYLTDTVTAEMIKLTLNSFFALKVVFANEIFDTCQKIGASYREIKEVLENHRWGSGNHFDIFHKGGRGAGGKCLAKDFRGMANLSSSKFFNQAVMTNEKLLEESKKE